MEATCISKIVHSPPLLPRKTVDKKQIRNEKKECRNKTYKIYALICTFANIEAIDSSGLKKQN